MKGADATMLIEWFRHASSDDPDKYNIANIIAHRPNRSMPMDLPFIRFYLYKHGGMHLNEDEFNKIVRIQKNAFYLSSGVAKLFGGDRTRNCRLILKIVRELTELDVAYTMSDQAKECAASADSYSGWVDLSERAHSDGGVLRDAAEVDAPQKVFTAAEISKMVHEGRFEGGRIKLSRKAMKARKARKASKSSKARKAMKSSKAMKASKAMKSRKAMKSSKAMKSRKAMNS
jgi:hypothetical protein